MTTLMKIKYFDIARLYLIFCIFIFPISSFWPGPSLILITDVLIILVVLHILLKKRLSNYMKWILILITIALLQMFLIMGKYNWDFTIFLQSRSIFVFLVIIFFYMYTLSNLDSYGLRQMSRFIELCIKLMIAGIVVDGIVINFLDMHTLFTNVFQSSIGNYVVYPNLGAVFSKVPNGLIFGAQHASILSVVGIIWWLPGIKNENANYLSKYLWFILSFLALVFSLTTTSVVVLTLTLLLILAIRLLRAQLITKLAFIILVPFTIGILVEKSQKFLTFIILNRYNLSSKSLLKTQMDSYYSYMVEQPINAFSKYYPDLLIGIGHTTNSSEEIDIVLEIGFIKLSVTFGFIFIGILILSYSIYMSKALYFVVRNIIIHKETNIILRLLLVNLVIVSSMMHYTTLFATGISQLFAAVIALSFVLIKKRITHNILL
jgi:hypothetical protein